MKSVKSFVVVTLQHGRTGSTLLAEGLGDLPGVKMLNEPFHPNPEVRKSNILTAFPPCGQSENKVEWVMQNLQAPEVYGMKIADWWLNRNEWGLLAELGMGVVFSTRRNWLESYTSMLQAQQSGLFHSPSDMENPKPDPVEVDIQSMQWDFREYREFHIPLAGRIAELYFPVVYVDYSELVADFRRALKKVVREFDWGYFVECVVPRYRKIASPDLRDRIKNYAETVSAYREVLYETKMTPFEHWFLDFVL